MNSGSKTDNFHKKEFDKKVTKTKFFNTILSRNLSLMNNKENKN